MKGLIARVDGWWAILVDGFEVNAFKTSVEVGRWLRERNGRIDGRSSRGHTFTTEYVLIEDLTVLAQITVVI